MTDLALGQELDVLPTAIRAFRAREGIPDHESWGRRRRSWVDEHAKELGVLADDDIARRANVQVRFVIQVREALGLPAPGAPVDPAPRDPAWLVTLRAHEHLVGRVPDRELAARLGLSTSAVGRFRAALGRARVGLPPTGGPRRTRPPRERVKQSAWVREVETRLRHHQHLFQEHLEDDEIARLVGVPVTQVARFRAALEKDPEEGNETAAVWQPASGPPADPSSAPDPIVDPEVLARLEAHRAIVGTVPDRTFATTAGASMTTARRFRVALGLPSVIPPKRPKTTNASPSVETAGGREVRLAQLQKVEAMMLRVTALELRSIGGLPVEETATLLREALELLAMLPGADRLTRDVRAAPEFVSRGPARARQAVDIVTARLRYAQLLLRSPPHG